MKLGMGAGTYNFGTWEGEPGGVGPQAHPQLHSKIKILSQNRGRKEMRGKKGGKEGLIQKKISESYTDSITLKN